MQLEPESLQYRMNGANVLAENQQPDAALAVLKAALPLGKTPQEREMIEGRIQSIESYRSSIAQVEAHQSTSGTRIELHDRRVAAEEAPAYPEGAPGSHHSVSGVLRDVKCSYPTVLTLKLERPANPVLLYTNNYFKVAFTTANYEPSGDILP